MHRDLQEQTISYSLHSLQYGLPKMQQNIAAEQLQLEQGKMNWCVNGLLVSYSATLCCAHSGYTSVIIATELMPMVELFTYTANAMISDCSDSLWKLVTFLLM